MDKGKDERCDVRYAPPLRQSYECSLPSRDSRSATALRANVAAGKRDPVAKEPLGFRQVVICFRRFGPRAQLSCRLLAALVNAVSR